ncbi:endonuclease/exonuclease/phosphatase family protein [Rhodohalobacter sp. SW132]|uniref:endonuclease/exonuclease/phosphatase family protein n=1 Tax=Rhodohalobacter sp. SW132 TaxID=2293433 RepID=UPI001314CD52|nr:endonuclease/exonuclease/phosphatase family protein [Rhodohalobacter sp. SW132]
MFLTFSLGNSTQADSVSPEFNEDNPITVMSYNIRFDNPNDGINAWPHRKDHVAEMMGPDKYSTDIVGLQEALLHQIEELQDRLPGYNWVGVGRDDGKDQGEFSPIFYRADRFDLVATNTFWLSENPEYPGSKSWDAAITRIVTWARFTDKQTGQDVYVLNTHFDHQGQQARYESSRIIIDKIASLNPDIPVILTGDLNINERNDAYNVLSEADNLHDARYASETGHEGPTATFNDWEELREPESRIDYIFVSDGVRVLNHRILDDRYDGRFPSDHLPVISDIILE